MVMVMRIPAPRYRWHEEELARHEISEFIGTEKKIGADWDTILAQGKANNSSFEQLASRVDSEVAGRYEQTFEQLSALQLNPNVPSAQMIVVLRRYTEERRDESRALAKGLRQHDQRQIVESLDRVRRAPEILRTPAVPHDK